MPEWFDVNAAIPGVGGASVHVLDARREEEVRRALLVAGFGLRTLEGGSVLSDRSFFREVGRALSRSRPLRPQLGRTAGRPRRPGSNR